MSVAMEEMPRRVPRRHLVHLRPTKILINNASSSLILIPSKLLPKITKNHHRI